MNKAPTYATTEKITMDKLIELQKSKSEKLGEQLSEAYFYWWRLIVMGILSLIIIPFIPFLIIGWIVIKIWIKVKQ